MTDWRPRLLEELRPAVLNFLHRVYFETNVKIFLGTMEGPVLEHPEFVGICAMSRWVPSLSYDDICNQLAEEVGMDLIQLETRYLRATEYHLWLYQVPIPNQEAPMIRYAKHIR